MATYQTSGTLGDSYITMLKLLSQTETIHLKHFVRGGHRYWRDCMSEILHLAPCVESVEFVSDIDPALPRIPSNFLEDDPEGIEITWFPENLEWASDFEAPTSEPYWVILTNSGKPIGFGKNTKFLPDKYLRHLIESPHVREVILLGTEKRFENICGPRTYNLVRKTTLMDAMKLVAGADYFFGPEGLLLFVALSHKVKSTGLFTSDEAMAVCVLSTPWEEYASLRKCGLKNSIGELA